MTTPGLDEIAARFREDGAGAAVSGTLEIALGRVAAVLEQQQRQQQRLDQLIHRAPITYAATGSGTFDFPDRFGPKDGFKWDVRRIAISGFTAGTVTLLKNDPVNGPTLATWSQFGEWTWSKQQWLESRDRLIFVAAGITGNVIIDGEAIAVSQQVYAEYVM